jgi:hypothetical protein
VVSSFTGRPAIWLMVLAATACAAVGAGFGLINGFPHGLTYDDAYFYAQIAYSIGETGRSSFDGASTTSGYHLLWGGALALLSAVVAPFTDDRIVHLFVLEAAFVVLALVVASTFFEGWIERVCVLAFVVMGTLLMETLLLSALLLIVARSESRRAPSAPVARAALAAALLVPLARIDAGLIIAVYVAMLVWDRERRAALALAVALGTGVLVQLAAMLWLFGEPFSVSSMIKASGGGPSLRALRSSMFGPEGIAQGYLMRFGLFVGLALAVSIAGFAGRRSTPTRRLLFLSIGAAAFTAGHVVSQMIPFWCYLPAYMVLFYTLRQADVRSPLLAAARRAAVAGIALLGTAFAAHKVYLYATQIEVVRGAREFVDAIAAHVPPDARIYQIDGSGFTGFFSGRAVVNGDGLVNTYEYARRARQGRLAGYLDERGICYVITNVALSGPVLVDFGGLVVTNDDVEEVLRTRTYGAFQTTDFVLHRRRAPPCAEREPDP